MNKRSIKHFLLRIPLFCSTVSFLTKNTPRIFMYHRFERDYDFNTRKMCENFFEEQLKTLGGRWRVYSFSEYIRLRKNGAKIPPYSVIITVDDGYHDFYKIAYPSLKKYNIPATIFITVNFVNQGMWQWWDKIYYVLKNCDNDRLSLIHELLQQDNVGQYNRKSFYAELVNHCKTLEFKEREKFLENLADKVEVAIPSVAPKEFRAMSWSEVKDLSDNNIEIGAHTLSHPILSQVDHDTARREIYESKVIIEDKIGRKVGAFCYPNGMLSDIDDFTYNQVKKAGYEGAVIGRNPGVGDGDLYLIPRIAPSSDPREFQWRLCGMEDMITGLKNKWRSLFQKPN